MDDSGSVLSAGFGAIDITPPVGGFLEGSRPVGRNGGRVRVNATLDYGTAWADPISIDTSGQVTTGDTETRHPLTLQIDATADFPFADRASKANALATMVTPVMRPAIEALVPLGVLDAPKQASGKSLLADVTCTIATGRPGAMMGAPANDRDAEWDKRITALLREGASSIVIDNVEGTVRAPSLCRALTCHTWKGRVLGFSQMLTLPQRTT